MQFHKQVHGAASWRSRGRAGRMQQARLAACGNALELRSASAGGSDRAEEKRKFSRRQRSLLLARHCCEHHSVVAEDHRGWLSAWLAAESTVCVRMGGRGGVSETGWVWAEVFVQ